MKIERERERERERKRERKRERGASKIVVSFSRNILST